MSVILWCQRLTWGHLCLRGMGAGILRVLIRQFYHCLEVVLVIG